MNYTKLLIYFILGFIVNIFFKRKNIEGFNFDIISASSYPDLIDIEDLETTYNINSKKILIKILESNIKTFSAEQNQDLKNTYFKATITPQMPVQGGHGKYINVYSFKGQFRLSDIEFLLPQLFRYNNNPFLSSILIPASNFEDYSDTELQPEQWWSENVINNEITIRRSKGTVTQQKLGRIRSRQKNTNQGYIEIKYPKNTSSSRAGYRWEGRTTKNIYQYTDYNDPNDNFTIQIISYLDADSNIIKNNKEKIKKYIYSQFFSAEQPQQ